MLGLTSLTGGPFVTVDIETTGCRPGTSSVIEIGAARIEDGVVTAHFSALVCPTEPIPPAVQHLTGITEEMTASAMPIEEAILLFRDFAAGAVLIAHNYRFDLSFLDYEAERAWGTPFPRPVLDTLCLARRLCSDVERHNLRDLALRYQIPTVPNHRAFPDALATAEVFLAMVPEIQAAGMTTAAEVARLCGVAQQSRLARKLALATHLPDGSGVYLFRDSESRVIFVGRAKSLRTRIRNHFYAADDTECSSPASEVVSIDHIPLVSGLDASLLEVRLHDRYQPAFNRNNHQQRRPVYLHLDPAADYPYLRPTRRRLRTGELVGPLGNEWAAAIVADIVAEHFGLRRCRRAVPDCLEGQCLRRDRHLCHAPDVLAMGPDAYRARAHAAFAVFNGEGADFREMLHTMQERSARAERFEDAARYRDAARALDRTLSALAVARRASADEVIVVLEGDEHSMAAIVLVRGWRFATIRFTADDVVSGDFGARILRVLRRAQQRARQDGPLTPRRLRDIGMTDAYRQQQAPMWIPVNGDPDEAAAQVLSAVRRALRVPRKRHAAV
ncbi:MAG: exonuclease domain-containing protein [Coriobacteriia bacterium]|nr:exonuclease domain-containing protein [Coriobacteriia bacterium]